MLLRDTPVSIDIGAHSVKVAQLIGGRGRVREIRCAEQELPPGFRWELGGDPTPLVVVIREAMEEAGIRARSAVIALPRRHITARIGAFPPVQHSELRRVIEYDLADHIPFSLDQVVLDFQPLGPSKEDPGLTDVLVVAAQNDLVGRYLELAQALRMRLAALTVDALALHDVVAMQDEGQPGFTVGIEIGGRAAAINVSEGRRLRLTRSVAFGGDQLTLAVRDDLGVDAPEAERLKRTEGFRLLDREPRPERMSAWLENLFGEIKRSALTFGPAAVSRILVGGAGAAVPGLRGALRSEFGVEPVLLSAADLFPGAQLRGEDTGAADRCLVAIAQGLRAIGKSRWKVSLVPAEVLQARRAQRLHRLGFAAAALAAMIAIGGYLLATAGLARREATVAGLEERLQIAEQQEAEVQEVADELGRLRTQLQMLDPQEARRHLALELLRTMAFYAPDEVVLTHVTLRSNEPVEIRGTAPTTVEISELQGALALSPLVTRVGLLQATRPSAASASNDPMTFTMKVHLWSQPQARVRTAGLEAPWEGGE